MAQTRREAKAEIIPFQAPTLPVAPVYSPPQLTGPNAFDFRRMETAKKGENAPDTKRIKETLEKFSLENMRYVGILKSGQKVSGFIEAEGYVYTVGVGNGLLPQAGSLLKPHLGKRAAIITNETVAPLYLGTLQTALDAAGVSHFSIILPDGEAHKNWQTLNLIFDGLMQNRAERKTTLIALGGGVIGDMVGFAAATYQRGAPFIQIPTTLLSQVDSSVGGKTAINHPLGKNMIGAFYQPQAVLADLDTLHTLPARELSAGMAEVIKYGALGDIGFFEWLEQHMPELMTLERAPLTQAVYRCCQMKADIVAQDETEQGIRAWLNLGHTFGHAVEAEMGYGVWLHGEAVAAGCVLAARLSEQLGKTSAADTARLAALLEAAGLPSAPPVFAFEKWLAHMSHDKKVSGGIMRFIGLNRLGEAVITEITDTDILRRTLQPYL
ncbi:3-dehydroquinate synthase [Neisseria gonorrhoeae]